MSATISQVAAAPGSIQSASPAPSLDAWWSMTTRGRDANRSALRSRDVPHPGGGRAVGEDEEVVGLPRHRVRADAPDPGHEPVQRRDRVGAHGRRPAAHRLDEQADAQHGTQRVGVGVLVADGQHVPGGAEAPQERLRDALAGEGLRDPWTRSSRVAPRLALLDPGRRSPAGPVAPRSAAARRSAAGGWRCGRDRRQRARGVVGVRVVHRIRVALVGQPLDRRRKGLVERRDLLRDPRRPRAPGGGGARGCRARRSRRGGCAAPGCA